MASDEAKRLHERRVQAKMEYKSVLADAEGRAFTAEERGKLTGLDDELMDLDKRIKSVVDADTRSKEADDAFNELEKRQRTGGMLNNGALGGSMTTALDVSAWAAIQHGHSVVDVRRQTRGSINTRTLLSTGTASATVPIDFYDQLISYLIEVSGLLQTGPTVLNTAGGETLQIPTVASHPTAATAAQGGVIPSADPSFSQKTLGAQKFGWQGSLSRELIDDTAVDLLSYLAMAAGRALGNTFGSALLLGGNGITGGLVPNVSTTVTGAASGSIATAQGQVVGGPSYGNLVDLEYSVIAPYRQSRSCYWLAADQSIGQLRKLTDTVGRPIWEPSTVLGSPDLLLGKPLVADPYMALFGHSNIPVLFGDFSQYFVRLVGGIRFERSDDFQFGNDLVTFRALIRGDGNLADANAIKGFLGG
jgi:HK97 family phage major capsid protein